MQIVIDIPEVMYEGVKLHRVLDTTVDCIIDAVENGTPLPKGHGKLIDVNSIPKEDRGITVKGLLYPGTIACDGAIDLEGYVNNLPTIIEADKVESEDRK